MNFPPFLVQISLQKNRLFFKMRAEMFQFIKTHVCFLKV